MIHATIEQIAAALATMTPEYARGANPDGEEQPWNDFDSNVEMFAATLRRVVDFDEKKLVKQVVALTKF